MIRLIRQEVTLPALPGAVYDALIDSRSHSAFTGAPAEISPDAGGAWSAYGGAIHGRNVDLVPGKRIVQAWRPASWPEGRYSLVHIELVPEAGATRIVLEHSGYPADTGEHLDAGWHARYWEPLRAWLAEQ